MEWQRGKRRVLLFLVAILPAIVLFGLATRVFRQEAELANKRAYDQRRDALEQLRRELATKLEAIKFQEVNRLRDNPSQPILRPSADSLVVFVLPIEQDHIVMPWGARPTMPTPRQEYLTHRREGELAEFLANDPSAAADAYRKTLVAGLRPREKCEAKLLLARALIKGERQEEASSIYHGMLEECDSVVDEDGMSFALYAAERLVSSQLDPAAARQYVLRRTALKLWWPPMQLYLMRSLMEGDPAEEAQQTRDRLSAQIDDTEQIVSLARDFHGVSLFRLSWFAYGSDPWLVTVMSPIPSAAPVVLAVSSKKVAPPGATFVAAHTETSTPLGEGFMDVDVEWQAGRFAPARRTPPGLYWAGFALVILATGLAGYLLLRDLSREVQTASLRSQFVASVSHELKTPLTAIRMFAETLALGRSKNERTSSEYLQTIVSESERLSRLVDNVLDFSRLEHGKKIYRMESSCLPDVVRAAARAMQYPLSQQGFHLTLAIDEEIPALAADADALEQAILNLLANAMKYSGDSREIELRLKRSGEEAIIEVADHGIGIPQEEHQRIFEKFYRVRSAATDSVAGAGLGLTLAMHIVKAHGGRLQVQSTVGTGSTFSASIPLPAMGRP